MTQEIKPYLAVFLIFLTYNWKPTGVQDKQVIDWNIEVITNLHKYKINK